MSDSVVELLSVMRQLRDRASGCPWDLAQDFRSIAPYTLEEAYEVVDAIERQDAMDLCEELGDLLLQVVFHAQMADEAGWFSFDTVVKGITQKLIRRHPHVFNRTEGQLHCVAQVNANWEQIKAQERAQKQQRKQRWQASQAGFVTSEDAIDQDKKTQDGQAKTTDINRDEQRANNALLEPPTQSPISVLDSIPLAMPALVRTQKLSNEAAKLGFDWPDANGAREKIAEEWAELNEALARGDMQDIRHELGDLMQACANLARKLDLNAEQCMREANGRFETRFRRLEALVGGRTGLSLEQLEAIWQQVKRQIKSEHSA
jgi:uncharacterized protein YabN with tetrapyrrole methylase and pyrophosphatase domain